MKIAENITFSSRRRCDRALIIKLRAIAPYMYDDLTGTARKLLHIKADEYIRENNIDVNQGIAQSACAG